MINACDPYVFWRTRPDPPVRGKPLAFFEVRSASARTPSFLLRLTGSLGVLARSPALAPRGIALVRVLRKVLAGPHASLLERFALFLRGRKCSGPMVMSNPWITPLGEVEWCEMIMYHLR